MDRKTISINPKLFEAGPKRRRSEKRKPLHNVNTSSLKRQLIQRIKHHKREKSGQHQQGSVAERGERAPDTKEIRAPDSEFHSAMEDLGDIVRRRKQTMKAAKPTPGVPPVLRDPAPAEARSRSPVIHINLPCSLSKPSPPCGPSKPSPPCGPSKPVGTKPVAPPYGCLKNGQKPTYKTWKNVHRPKSGGAGGRITIVDTDPMEDSAKGVGSLTYRQKRLDEIKRKLKARDELKDKENAARGVVPKKVKRTVRSVHALGKSGKSVKVLIKNSQTRKNDQIAKNIINQTDMRDVKLYLRNQGLLAAGSDARRTS